MKLCKMYIALALMVICCFIANAKQYDTEVDGICYNLNGNEAIVTIYSNNENTNSEHYQGMITIPNTIMYQGKTYTVTTIGEKTFCLCSKAKEIHLPNSLTTICKSAFRDIVGLRHLYMGAKVENIAPDAFCLARIDTLDFDSSNKHFVFEDKVLYTADHKRAITLVCNHKAEGIKVWLHNGVESIDDGFANSYRLDSVRFGNAIKSIGDHAFHYAFADTDVQKELILPDGITHIGQDAFNMCIMIQNLHLPDSLTRLEMGSFNMVDPTYIHMPKKLKVVCDYALNASGASYFNLVLPEGLDSIGVNGITGISCDSLIVPASVRYLSEGCLENECEYIEIRTQLDSIASEAFPSQMVKELVLPKSVKKLCSHAFYPCYRLEKIVWPEALEYIGPWALAGNQVNPMIVPSTVKTLDYGSLADNKTQGRTYYFTSKTPPECLNDDIFGYIEYEKSTLCVPKGCLDAYICKSPWNWFGTVKEYDDASLGIKSPAIETNSKVYDISGRPVGNGYKDLIIKNGKVMFKQP